MGTGSLSRGLPFLNFTDWDEEDLVDLSARVLVGVLKAQLLAHLLLRIWGIIWSYTKKTEDERSRLPIHAHEDAHNGSYQQTEYGTPWDLPPNIILKTMSKLPTKDFCCCSCISRSWRLVSHDPSFELSPSIRGKGGTVLVKRVSISHHIICSAKCERLIAVGGEGFVTLLDLMTSSLVSCNVAGGVFNALCVTRESVLGGNKRGVMFSWDKSDGEQIRYLQAHGTCITSIIDVGDCVATASFLSDIKLWRKKDWTCKSKIRTCVSFPYALCTGLEGDHIYYGGAKSSICVGSISASMRIEQFPSNNNWIQCLCRQGELLFCGWRGESSILIFDIKIGSWVGMFKPSFDLGSIKAIDSDGCVVVGGYSGRSIAGWYHTHGRSLCNFSVEGEVVGVWIYGSKIVVVESLGHISIWEC
ncbi:hypothetical protein BSKO_02777 [Bryopsis sp. KO-2023]|nr:hypothetical protein BSKO_02777 [Bryopsis sp. KO-2023]